MKPVEELLVEGVSVDLRERLELDNGLDSNSEEVGHIGLGELLLGLDDLLGAVDHIIELTEDDAGGDGDESAHDLEA